VIGCTNELTRLYRVAIDSEMQLTGVNIANKKAMNKRTVFHPMYDLTHGQFPCGVGTITLSRLLQ
jgi:hypothetical protein